MLMVGNRTAFIWILGHSRELLHWFAIGFLQHSETVAPCKASSLTSVVNAPSPPSEAKCAQNWSTLHNSKLITDFSWHVRPCAPSASCM